MSDTQIFKLINFSPIGFKKPNYPVQYCSLCRGYLTDVCTSCIENHRENCVVVNYNDVYYHQHCYNFMNNPASNNKTVAKKVYDSESE